MKGKQNKKLIDDNKNRFDEIRRSSIKDASKERSPKFQVKQTEWQVQ